MALPRFFARRKARQSCQLQSRAVDGKRSTDAAGRLGGGKRKLRRVTETSAEAGSKRLRLHMLGLYTAGTMPATSIGILCHHITEAGGAGVADMAVDPATAHAHRNAARTLSRATDLDFVEDSLLMPVVIPLHNKRKNKTIPSTTYVVPFYEVLHREIEHDEALYMHHRANPDALSRCFYEHTEVQDKGSDRCFPLRLFIDFARLDNKWSKLNIYVSCVHAQLRIPFACLRKAEICRCGCRGAHTIQPLMSILAWCFRVSATGVWPVTGYDGHAWPPASWRASKAGQRMARGLHGILSEVSCDLDEYTKSLGCPHYNSTSGCLRCWKTKDALSNFAEHATERDHQEFIDAAAACFHRAPIDHATVARLADACRSSRKKGGIILQRVVPGLPNIRKGDRLEPSHEGLPDITHGQQLSDFPESQRRVVFYRKPADFPFLFISRLFTISGTQPGIPGLTLRHFLYDSMHVLELGVCGYLVHHVFWQLIGCEHFGRYDADTKDIVERRISKSLAEFYSFTRTPHDARVDFSMHLLGSPTEGSFKGKAGHTRRLLPYVLWLLRRGGKTALDASSESGCAGSAILESADALESMFNVLDSQPRTLSPDALHQVRDLARRCVLQWIRAGGSTRMKHHVLGDHLADQCEWAGNVRWTHNYSDESANFAMRTRAQSTNRQFLSRRTLSKWYLEFLNSRDI
eukprot:TRINITY_DN101083_c0_g1_i1.p1 TRINITY_DN101083_c0_g1~~TRINITY_DN101083_c0_g1_i1.p1  ORF type:complete len:691 (+),score=49.20 TRINITY_DN101083_c0_g1_i1:78-2150(+)